MDKYTLAKGAGRTKVNLSAYNLGGDPVVCIYNAHIGAVAVGSMTTKRDEFISSRIG